VLQRAEQALEAIDGGQNFTSAELEQRLREIRSRLLAVLAECNTTELEMQYVRSRT
jgi:flagellar basal body-associated protein FliL